MHNNNLIFFISQMVKIEKTHKKTNLEIVL